MANEYLIAVDPGKHCGVALFNIGIMKQKGTAKLEWKAVFDHTEMGTVLEKALEGYENIAAVVVEDFIGQPGHNVGSRIEAVQVIGICQDFARRIDATFVRQQPAVRSTASKWGGIKVPKGHTPDDLSAELHGIYWLIRNARPFETALERKMRNG